jgi:hypothetical protein
MPSRSFVIAFVPEMLDLMNDEQLNINYYWCFLSIETAEREERSRSYTWIMDLKEGILDPLHYTDSSTRKR